MVRQARRDGLWEVLNAVVKAPFGEHVIHIFLLPIYNIYMYIYIVPVQDKVFLKNTKCVSKSYLNQSDTLSSQGRTAG